MPDSSDGKKFSATGDAGEFLVAAEFTRALQWPYRMQKFADLGIDGELEIFGDDGSATGRFIKVQVKTTESAPALPETLYLSAGHVAYWRLLAVPVVVCRVHLQSRRVMWRPVDEVESARQNFKLVFDEAHTLDGEDAGRLRELATPRAPDLARGAMSEVQRQVDRVTRWNPVDAAAQYEDFIYSAEETQALVQEARGILRLLETMGLTVPPDARTQLAQEGCRLQRFIAFVKGNRGGE